ncbi:MAG TPA: TlpA disulfide reductase family protein [Gemmatimonadales bacterium]|jgi:peroxiredoxin|nr:TlpA disulfide reductase family protein [Gemmatimonadales bacterium]
MSRQWMLVGAIIGGLAVGATALAKYGPEREGATVGARAPNFRVIDLATGDSVSLRERYRGSVTLVNIWATWCVPCKVEMPSMQRLYDQLGPRGLKIAAVSIDEGDPTDVRNFAHELGLTFDILQDRSTAIQQAYQTTGVPESFLLDRSGTIVKRVIGAHDWNSEVNRSLVERLLAEPAGER